MAFMFETELLVHQKPDSNTVKHSEKSTQLAQKLSTGYPTQGQPQHGISSSSDVGAAHGASPLQMATSEDMGRAAQITHERNPSLNGLPSQPAGVDDKPRCVPQEDNDSESSKEHLAKLVTPDTSSEKEVVWLELERLIELERELLAMRAGKAERDRRIAQLTDQLVQKSALLEQAEANVAEAKKRAGLEQRELQAKLDELLLSRDRAEANAAEAKKRAGLEQRELQAKLDESLLSRDQAEANAAEAKKRAELEQHDLQAKLDELLLSRDQAFGQAQSALQKATFRAAEANERSQRELAEVHVKLEARESELAAVRLRLTDAEDGWAKSKVEAGTSRVGTQAAAGLVDMDMDRVIWRLMERVRVVEAEMASLRGNEKSIESMECRNEG
jgi:DNA repair exonuclease SbcCD ATPase subunit